MKSRIFVLQTIVGLGLFVAIFMSYGNTGCGAVAEGINDLTSFCRAVGDKCSGMNANDCVNKLGGNNAVLKSSPDYKGAKECVDALTSCTVPPDNCWFFAVEKFTSGGENNSPDAGAKE